MRRVLFIGLGALAWLVAIGCEVTNRASQGLSVNPFNIFYSEPVVQTIDDERYWNGEPMDLRRDRK